jgi:hypothetical protein
MRKKILGLLQDKWTRYDDHENFVSSRMKFRFSIDNKKILGLLEDKYNKGII